MAGLIEVIAAQTGISLYAIIRKQGQVWNGSSFETFNSSNWSTYDVPLAEQTGSYYYSATFPAAITDVAKYTIAIHQQLGGSPAFGDPPYGNANIPWDGSAEEQGIGAVLKTYNLHKLAHTSAAGSPPTLGSWLDILMSKNSGQTYDQSTDSLEAIRDGGSGGPTAAQIADAVWDELVNTGHATSNSAAVYLKAIYDKLPGGTISDFDESANSVNLNASQSSVTIGTVNNLGTNAKAHVNAEVVDALFTDTISELSSGAPTSTPTIAAALMLLYMMVRNKHTATGSEEKVYNNAGSAIAKATVSDNGTIFTKEQYGAP